MVKVRCPHCGGSLDVCIESGDIRRIERAAGTTAFITGSEILARKAAKLADCPDVVLHTTEATKALEEAYQAILKDLDNWADVKEKKEGIL